MPEPTDTELLADCYEAISAIYNASEDREALPERLQKALDEHQPLGELLAKRCAP